MPAKKRAPAREKKTVPMLELPKGAKPGMAVRVVYRAEDNPGHKDLECGEYDGILESFTEGLARIRFFYEETGEDETLEIDLVSGRDLSYSARVFSIAKSPVSAEKLKAQSKTVEDEEEESDEGEFFYD